MGSAAESGAETRFHEYLRSQELKFTSDRRGILREVFDIHDHFEAEDVVLRLRERGARVSRASVYRTLPLLVESGLLREVHSSDKHSHYEHVFGHEHHDHMICADCGRILEFNDPELERLEGEICGRRGFRPRFHTLEIHGQCRQCAERARESRPEHAAAMREQPARHAVSGSSTPGRAPVSARSKMEEVR